MDIKGQIIEIRPCNNCNQPERSKREDSVTYDLSKLSETDTYKFVKALGECERVSREMRCSEHYGDIVRPAEKIWPA